jgi:hypothetical protein
MSELDKEKFGKSYPRYLALEKVLDELLKHEPEDLVVMALLTVKLIHFINRQPDPKSSRISILIAIGTPTEAA